MTPAADAAPAPHAHTPRRKNARRRRIPPALLRRPNAADYCGMPQSTFDRADACGLVPQAIRIGGVKAWSRKELIAWIDAKCPPRNEWAPIWTALLARRNRVK